MRRLTKRLTNVLACPIIFTFGAVAFYSLTQREYGAAIGATITAAAYELARRDIGKIIYQLELTEKSSNISRELVQATQRLRTSINRASGEMEREESPLVGLTEQSQ
jgi:hypothetical protein